MKTSKVKAITECKEYTNDYGTTYYHNIEMENGDKLNIGKKKKLSIGTELTYEFVGDLGQHEYTKAKTVNPEYEQKQSKNADYIKGIEVGHAVNNAVNLMAAGVELDVTVASGTNEEKIYEYAKKIMAIANRLKSE
jgi:hypothetical protein